MATIERTKDAGKQSRLLLIGFGAAVAVAAVLVSLYLLRPPQMGTSEEAFKTVDALFTAVTARDEKLLGQCEHRLHTLNDAGQVPPQAWRYLEGILQKAHAGRWQPAAERLYDFMIAQRREGPRDRLKEDERRPRGIATRPRERTHPATARR